MFFVPATPAPPLTLNHIVTGICLNAVGFWADQAIV